MQITLPFQLGLIGLIVLFSMSGVIDDGGSYKSPKDSNPIIQPVDSTYMSHPMREKVDSLITVRNVEEAINLYHSTLDSSQNIIDGIRLYIAVKIANGFNILGDFDQALNWLKKGSLEEPLTSADAMLTSEFFHQKAVAYNFLEKADSAEKYHHLALKIRKDAPKMPPERLFYSYMGLGNIKRYLLHDYDSATQYFELAAQTLSENTSSADNESLFRCNYNLAATFRLRQNLDKALVYARETLRNAQDMKVDIYISFAHNLLLNTYVDVKDFDNAEKHARELISLYKSAENPDFRILINCYLNLGINQNEKGNHEEAIQYLKEGLEYSKVDQYQITVYRNLVYQELGKAYEKLGKNEMALKNFQLSLAFTKNSANKLDKFLSYEYLGNFYANIGQPDSALFYIQQALNNADGIFPKDDWALVPPFDSIPHTMRVFKFIQAKADIISQLRPLENETENYTLALNNYLLGDSIITAKRSDDLLESEELWMANEIQSFYWNAINCFSNLSSRQQNTDLNLALRFMDQNKSRIMLRSLKKSLFLESNGVHDSLVQYNRDINAALAHWKNSDDKNKEEVEQKIFQLISQKSRVDDLINSTYKNFEKSFQKESLSVEAMQQVARDDKTLVLEYYQTQDKIFRLSISSDRIQLDEIVKDSIFDRHFLTYKEQLSNANPFDQDNFKKYVEASSYLFKQLIPLNIDTNKYRSIAIIPDGQLTAIPFESLIISKPATEVIDYSQLDYLIKSININYYHSGHSFIEEKKQNYAGGKLSIAGWAYETIPGKEKLQNAIREIDNISADIDKKLFKEAEATKNSFINLAAEYDIIHLAIHGTDNTDSANIPSLQFYPSDDDGILYNYEIYRLPLSARMVVLSACKTGSGAVEQGEGMFSMARSFFYAGCPSVVLSLWNLKDKSGSEIITSYYANLKSGHNKDVSMRAAKLEYISEKDNYLSHPSFWAGTILIGNDDALWKGGHKQKAWPLIITSVMAMLTILIFLYKKGYYFNRIRK